MMPSDQELVDRLTRDLEFGKGDLSQVGGAVVLGV